MRDLLNKRNIGIAIVVVLLIGIGGIAFVMNQPNKKAEDIKDEKEVVEHNDPSPDTKVTAATDIYNEYYKIESMSIEPSKMDDEGVSLDSAFQIKVKGDLELEDLKKHLKVSSKSTYQIERRKDKTSDDDEVATYDLVFDEPLEAGKVVNMVFDKVKVPYGFAFETKKTLRVSGIYPTNGASYVYTNSVVEIYFSKDIEDSISDYISIEPGIPGSRVIEDNVFRFLPEGDLPIDTTFTVSILPGYIDDGTPLEVYQSQFTTVDYAYNSNDGFRFNDSGGISYFLPNMPIRINGYSSPYDDGDQVNCEVYRVEDPEKFKAYTRMSMAQIKDELGGERTSSPMTFTSEYLNYSYALRNDIGLDLGYYYLVLDDGQSKEDMLLQVSHYNAFAVADIDQLLVWVQNNGGDLSNECKVILEDGTKLITDENGLANVEVGMKENASTYIAVETTEKSPPLIVKMDLGSYEESVYDRYWSITSTDRAVYLPSDEIHISGLVKHKDHKKTDEVTVKLLNLGKVIDEKHVPLSNFGDYQAQFSYENINSYGLSIEVHVEGQLLRSKYVTISAFEKPVYTITTTTDKSVLALGESISVSGGDVKYFEGTGYKEPTVVLDCDWDMTMRGLGDSVLVEGGDEHGHFDQSVELMYETDSWWPKSAYFRTELSGIDNYYDDTYTYITVVPRDVMAMTETQESGEGFSATLSLNKILIDQISNTYNDPNSYKGAPYSGNEVKVKVTDIYYEAVFLGQVYDPIMKVYYDDYDYKRIESIVANDTQVANEDGQVIVTYPLAEKDHGYHISFEFEDTLGRRIIEDSYFGTANVRQSSRGGIDETIYLSSDDYAYELGGEEIELYIEGENGRYIADDNDKLLVISVTEGIDSARVTNEAFLNMTYPDTLTPPSIRILSVFYDGSSMRQGGYGFDQWLYVDKESLKGSMEVTFDKTSYGPGELVKAEVKAKDANGNGLEGYASIKVIDEAYYALYEDYYEPIDDLIPWYVNDTVLGKTIASSWHENVFYGAEGGEGGDDGIRNDFKNTAYTDHITLDKDGNGHFEFVLPDNLTNWRVTITGVNEALNVAMVKENVIASKPFFVTWHSTDAYHAQDSIGLTFRSALANGQSSISNGSVDYLVSILREGNVEFTKSVTGDIAAYMFLPVGQLDIGDYEVFIEATYGTMKDTLQYPISVKETRQNFRLNQASKLSETTNLVHNDELVNLTLMNQLAYERYQTLVSMTNTNYDRLEYEVVSYMTKYYLSDNGFDYELGSKPYIYLRDNNLYSPLYNSDGMVSTSVDLLLAGFHEIMIEQGDGSDIERLKIGLRQALSSGRMTIEEDAYAALGLSILGEPMLLEMSRMLDDQSFRDDKLATLYLLKGLSLYKDYQTVIDILDSLDLYNKTQAQLSGMTIRELAVLMSIYGDINADELAGGIYEHLFESTIDATNQVPVIAWQYDYLTNLPTNLFDVSVTVNEGEHKEVIVLDYNDIYEKTFTPEQIDALSFSDLAGEIYLISNFIGSNKDVMVSDGLKLETQLSNANLQIGDLLTIQHEIEVEGPLYQFVLQDVIPSGLVYVGGDVTFASSLLDGFVYNRSSGKNNEFFAYAYPPNEYSMGWPDKSVVTISYSARATAIGTYNYEPAVVTNYSTGDMAIGNEGVTSIEK